MITQSNDLFLSLGRPSRRGHAQESEAPALMIRGAGAAHDQRAHSKFSASGAERWFNCPGSVALSEGLPDKSSAWAEEGTRAHEVLEAMLTGEFDAGLSHEMRMYCAHAANHIRKIHKDHPGSELMVEKKVFLDSIHPEMFGTLDAAVIEHFGMLHVFDFKYGAGVCISPIENLQMIFYGLAVAHSHHWNFKNIRLWIIQPRVKGYDGPVFWDLPVRDALLLWWVAFEVAVANVEKNPEKYVEGSWCHWCKAKSICPLKTKTKMEAAQFVFGNAPKDF